MKEEHGQSSNESQPSFALDQTVALSEAKAEQPGMMIGRYKLLQKIGEGGFGVVWAAEQREPVRRRVALKIIKLGMDSRQVVARFEAERQALAMMDHPNIAKVFDAGATETGRPYFVMELVRGISITSFCDQERLGATARLELLITVCQAVQHAHQKGIIHRDIKPTNILVSLDEGQAIPKVIDFGIAKATQQPLTDKTVFTQFQQFLGTPDYMSPEQAEMSALDIDTRTDIYNLGVLLYELLTGKTPFNTKDLLRGGWDEMRRIIRDQNPPKPSTRLSTLIGEELTTTARHRQSDPVKLINLLRGDLDWIVMKCLEKDRARRYQTANALGMDIRRHLSHEPVLARPPSASYRFQKVVARNKLLSAVICAATLALISGALVSVSLAIRAMRAERLQAGLRQEADQARVRERDQRHLAEQALANEAHLREQAQLQEQAAREILYAADMNLAQQALRVNNLGRARSLLDRHRPAAGAPDLRGWEWRYLATQSRSYAHSILVHQSNTVSSLSFAPHGHTVAIGTVEGEIFLWNIQPERLVATVQTNGQFASVAFSPAGQWLAATAESGTVNLWETEKLTVSQRLRHGGRVRSLSFSPSGERLAIYGQDRRLTLWEGTPWKEIRTFDVRASDGWHWGTVAFSHDDRWIALGNSDGSVEILDLNSGAVSRTIRAHSEGITSLAFTLDGGFVISASSYAETMPRVWNLATGTLETKLEGHTAWVASLIPIGNGRLLSAAADQTIRLWNTATWNEVAVLRGHQDEISSLTVAQNGRWIVSGSRDGSVLTWDVHSLEQGASRRDFPPEMQPLGTALDGRTVFGKEPDGKIIAFNMVTGKQRDLLNLTNAHIDFAGQGMIAVHEDSKTLRFWELGFDGAKEKWQLAVGRHVGAITYNPQAALVGMGIQSNIVQVMKLDGLAPAIELHLGPIAARPVAIANHGRELLTYSPDRTLRLWDLASKRQAGSATILPNPGAAQPSRDCELFAAGYNDGSVRVWRLKGATESVLKLQSTPLITDLQFSPDGRRLAIGTQRGEVKVWAMPSGEELLQLRGHLNGVHSVAFSPDGWRLASGSGGNEAIKLWDLHTGQEVLTLSAPASPYRRIEFAENSSTIVISGSNGGSWSAWHAPLWSSLPEADHAKAP